MARYKVILVYDGTAFKGMQRQAEARTVQAVVEDALRKISRQGLSIIAAGRTDSGVHASGQVIAFDLDWRHSEQDLLNAVNANLPEDVAARQVSEVNAKFHPRYDALARRYRYETYCQPLRDPLRDRYAWQVWPALDFELVQKASEALLGEHDFAAFGSPPTDGGSTIRRVSRAEWFQQDDRLSFEVVANAFLYRMVRRMVKLLVEIGQGVLELQIVNDLLSDPQEMIQGLAPPQGLFLAEVTYADNGNH